MLPAMLHSAQECFCASLCQIRAFVLRHLFYLVTRLLEVDLQSFSIAIVLDRSLPLDLHGRGRAHVPTALDGIGSTMTIQLSHLNIHNAGVGGYGVLSTDVKLKGFSMDIDVPSQSTGPGGKSAGQPDLDNSRTVLSITLLVPVVQCRW